MSSTADERAPACPPLDVRWLHLGQPYLSLAGAPVSALSEHYAAFSKTESAALEARFHALAPADRAATRWKNPSKEQLDRLDASQRRKVDKQNRAEMGASADEETDADERLEQDELRVELAEQAQETEMTVDELERAEGEMGVSIAKDGLFEVDVKEMKLYPVFWTHRGPNIPVRRGTWFYDHKTPVPDELGDDLETGYQRSRSWVSSYPVELMDRLKQDDASVFVPLPTASPLGFGSHVLYQDGEVAEVVIDKGSITSRISQTLWGALNSSGTFSGGRLVFRGWEAAVKGSQLEVDPDSLLDGTPESNLEEGVEVPSHKENGEPGEPAAEEVRHLFLVVHGIGQQLAVTHESFNSVYDSNSLRMQAQLLAQDESISKLMGDEQVQFLPIQWRGSLKLKHEPLSDEDQTHSLTNRFALEDVTLNKSVAYVREIMNNVLIDVPFYLSKHRQAMIEAVAEEANRTYRLWCRRHPNFEKDGGKVHLIGHSLGSALIANILSNQPTVLPPLAELPKQVMYKTKDRFIFNTHALFLAGSPLGLFMHIEQAQIVPRRGRARTPDAPVGVALDRAGRFGCFSCDSVFNIFSTADPVAYQLNATVDAELGRAKEPISIPSAAASTLDDFSQSVGAVYGSVENLVASFNFNLNPWSSETESDLRPEPETEPRIPEQRKPPRSEVERRVSSSLAEQRFSALNRHANIDFFLPKPTTSISEYVDLLSAHGSYWTDPSFAAFLLTEVFANPASSTAESVKAAQAQAQAKE